MILLRSLYPAIFGLAVAAAVAWLFGDQVAAWWLVAVVVVHALIQAGYLIRLHHWAALPRARELPIGTLAWASVFDRLGRFVRSEGETRTELTDELAQVHAAVDQLPDGLVLIDRYDQVDWCNNAAAELHGIFGVARPIHHFIRQPEFVAYLDSDDYSKPPIVTLPARPGRLYELRLHRTEGGNRLLISRDVTEHAKVDAMRRDFVANVSHEIRTPVTVIGGFAETLLNIPLDEAAQREYLNTILKQSHTMQRLVEDLLTLATLESTDAPPADERIDVHAMIQALAADARALSQGRHTIDVDLEAPPLMRAAPMEIESAIRNLLTNAVRYTPDGGRIRIEWRLRNDEVWLTVRDTGIGIAADHLPRLTERFYRVDRGRSRETGGTGLGLAIVKHIAHHHDGQLHVESHLGEGSAFSLRLPTGRLLAGAPTQPADETPIAPA